MRRAESIPILLLTGFLGSGKTTLLNYLLTNSQGLKVGVVVNDFGQVNIDSLLVTAQTDSTLELSNGCICCSVEDGQLDNALGQLAHRGSQLDYIVIEASGLAEPRELATLLRLAKNNYCHFDTLVSLIDGVNFDKNRQTHASAFKDLEIADIIIINKIDLINKKELVAIEKALKLVAPKSRLLTAERAQVDWRLLLDSDQDKASQQLKLQPADEHHLHLHHQFQSVSFQTDKPLDWRQFEVWAEALATNIFRAKGVIDFGAKGAYQKFVFQAVGQRHSLKLDEWQPSETPGSQLVVIGTDLDQTELKKQFNQLIDKQPDDVRHETLIDIFKYR